MDINSAMSFTLGIKYGLIKWKQLSTLGGIGLYSQVLKRSRQEDFKLKGCLNYSISSRPVKVNYPDPVSK